MPNKSVKKSNKEVTAPMMMRLALLKTKITILIKKSTSYALIKMQLFSFKSKTLRLNDYRLK